MFEKSFLLFSFLLQTIFTNLKLFPERWNGKFPEFKSSESKTCASIRELTRDPITIDVMILITTIVFLTTIQNSFGWHSKLGWYSPFKSILGKCYLSIVFPRTQIKQSFDKIKSIIRPRILNEAKILGRNRGKNDWKQFLRYSNS